MVDGANWGQDWQRIMYLRAGDLLESDPLRNLIFSVHMYEVYGSEDTVRDYLSRFSNQGWCLVVGEFANTHYGKPVDAKAILRWAEHLGFGYLGWSWSGNNPDTAALDLVEYFDSDRLTEWGRLLFHSEHGIANTA